jgi:predicted transcriptional regulator
MTQKVKPVNELILEKLAAGSLSRKKIFEIFSDFQYALDAILDIEKNAGRIEKFEQEGEDFYRITDKGKELLTYRFNRKFLRLHA